MEHLKRLLGSVIFLPFIFCYSYVVGPLLMAVLVPGGVVLLLLILGFKDGKKAFKDAFLQKQSVKK
ncbi:hypothetical protein AN214_00724 [Pseudoalteromonas sp. P1-9]|uniref:hypothetical protein n=1 Tax=Pseudoalteromonas sp. P1-9 TaxID=1710354 RepID=UPI0006D622A9|nr:hypothetical protein [Pseudoalteromonas sp. P1-9]KPV97746.1 hypothetical protein AN214_00724 [Pseudoalteromonas sp. P1-9]